MRTASFWLRARITSRFEEAYATRDPSGVYATAPTEPCESGAGSPPNPLRAPSAPTSSLAPLIRSLGLNLGLDVASESALAAGLVMGMANDQAYELIASLLFPKS
jgi:hypothetical protein